MGVSPQERPKWDDGQESTSVSKAEKAALIILFITLAALVAYSFAELWLIQTTYYENKP